MNALITSDWLEECLEDDSMVIIDASQSNSVNKLENTISNIFIPGAIRIELKDWSDQESPLPNTFPSPDYFESRCREIGVNNDSKIVIYDNQGVYFSPRVWWMFKTMGHGSVAVLDGGLPGWVEEGRVVSKAAKNNQVNGDFHAKPNFELIKSYDQVFQNIDSDDYVVVDARSKGRFDGTAPEPREGLPSGHIPKSVNIPYTEVLNGPYLKNQNELQEVFNNRGLTDKQLVFSCGSGLTACIVAIAQYQLSNQLSPIYDGSWTEWAQIESSPITTVE